MTNRSRIAVAVMEVQINASGPISNRRRFSNFIELGISIIHSYLAFSHIMTPSVKEHELPSQLVSGTAIKAT